MHATSVQHAVALLDANGPDNRRSIHALTLLARVELERGDGEGTETQCPRRRRTKQTLAGFAHSEWLGRALIAQGMAQRAGGQTETAKTSWRAALAELQATVDDAAPATAEVRRLLIGG